ncbi:hypothetical protein [Agromyces humatus]|uniref:Uncharacterized protein n=1 Tax=Agromyces humatus TaxID=279573 RepID=A0ABN2KRH3_9MICO|nr:hypothetical protein [Agromyces humatus]
MNDDNELDPVARLRAADPAADVEPRAGFSDEVVARATADAAAEQGAEAPDEAAPVTDLAAARARRRPRWLPVAAVAASIAIVGAAGYGLGASTGAPANLADGPAAPPISLQSDVGTSGGEAADGAVPGGIAGGAAAPELRGTGGAAADSATTDSIYPNGFGRNQFSSSGLDSAEGTAQAYTFDAYAASTQDTVAALAAALGIVSPVELRDGSWIAGPPDFSGPYLSVGLNGTLSFYFQNPHINPWLCVEGAEVCEPTGTTPTEAAAIDALRSLVVAAGLDPAAFEFTSQVWEGSTTRWAEAWPVVVGQRIDQGWSLEIAEDGVINAYGSLAPIVPLGEYPVVSEQAAFERLSDPRFGALMGSMPFAARASDTPAEEWVPPTEPPATPAEGTSLSWPVNDVEIVSARLGLASEWQPDGSVLVIPAYEFTDADGGTWSVIAVADSMLDFEAE